MNCLLTLASSVQVVVVAAPLFDFLPVTYERIDRSSRNFGYLTFDRYLSNQKMYYSKNVLFAFRHSARAARAAGVDVVSVGVVVVLSVSVMCTAPHGQVLPGGFPELRFKDQNVQHVPVFCSASSCRTLL